MGTRGAKQQKIVRGRHLLVVALLVSLLLSGCVELNDALATPTPIATATPEASPTPFVLLPNPLTPPAPSPTVEVDIFKLLPEGYQPLAIQRVDLDGDGSLEWVVLAGKVGQPTFETVVPLAIGVFGGVARELWRGQPDFAVSQGGDLKVLDLTGDGRPEIVYINHTPMGGTYAFVYAGSTTVTSHDALPPAGGPLEGVGFFAGWDLQLVEAANGQPAQISAVTDLAGTRWNYRWDGAAFRAAETIRGTPFPTPPALKTPPPADPEAYDVSHDLGVNDVQGQVIDDLDGDGVPEIAVLYLSSDSGRLQIAIFAYGGAPGFPVTYRVVWSSGPLAGTENQVFKLRDLSGDGKMEVLSGQGGAAAGAGTLYTLGYSNGAYGFIKPVGGRFDGRDSVGDGDYVVQEQGAGKAPLLLGTYDDGAHSDVYQWDNGVFKFLRTQ